MLITPFSPTSISLFVPVGIVILNFKDYMTACYEHILSSVPIQSDTVEPKTYYKAVNEFAVEEAKIKI